MATKMLRWGILTVLAVGLVLGGCGKQAEQGTAKPGEKPAEKQQVIELKYADFNPQGIGITLLAEKAAKMVGEKTNGRIKVTPYFSGTLLKYPETFKGVSTGVADIAFYLVGGTPGVHQLTEVFNLPFLGFKNVEDAARAYKEIIKYPEIQAENEKLGVRWLAIRPMMPFHLHMTNKQVRLPEDLKGQKILAEGHFAQAVSAVGGVAMNMGPTDWYTSLQKGVVTGHLTHWIIPMEFKTGELQKYHTVFGTGGAGNGGIGFLVNLETWKKLSPEDQKVLEEVYDWLSDECLKLDIGLEKQAIEQAKNAGHKIIELTPQEVQVWADKAGKPAIEKWIADTEAKGLPARKIYEAVKQMAAK
ncbi:MAG: TRAP transporter substrate-binding protein DctP [Peptococcaceae bacterium]|nr:TRAP transporter substrate-binding protein DctP [Peptococcaceae bacterium]